MFFWEKQTNKPPATGRIFLQLNIALPWNKSQNMAIWILKREIEKGRFMAQVLNEQSALRTAPQGSVLP